MTGMSGRGEIFDDEITYFHVPNPSFLTSSSKEELVILFGRIGTRERVNFLAIIIDFSFVKSIPLTHSKEELFLARILWLS